MVSTRHISFLVGVGFLLMTACAPGTSIKMEQGTSVRDTEKVESKYTGPKRLIGVVAFDVKAPYAAARLGDTATDILVTELFKSGKFIIVERGQLDKVLAEQKLGQSGAIDARTAAQVGKVLGLSAIVTGSVSQFGVKKEGKDFGLNNNFHQFSGERLACFYKFR